MSLPPSRLPPFARPVAWLLVVVIVLAWSANLGHRVLQHPDEGRYAEIAREMEATGDWLTPRLDGLKYFEKPPLQYWLTAASFRAFGLSDWSARLVPVVAGLGAVLAVAWAGARLGGPALAWAAGLMLAGTLWQVALSQILTLDALLSALLALAFATCVVAQQATTSATRRRQLMLVAWAAIGLATLTKGPIAAVIPAGAVVFYCMAQRDLTLVRRLHLGWGLLVAALIAVPWFVAVSRANPEFARFFFIHEHFERFLTTEHRRTGAWWYFVPLFLAGSVPWLLILGAGLPAAWRGETTARRDFHWPRFALAWAAFVFLFFSASGSKLPSYILPMFPPLALVAGWLCLRLPTAWLARLALVTALPAIALAVTALVAYAPLASHFADSRQPMSTLLLFGPWLKLAVASAAIAGVGASLLFRRGERGRLPGVAALALGTLACTQLVVGGLDSFRTTRSSYDILRVAANAPGASDLADPAVPFFQVRMYDQTVPYYLRRITTLVEFRDELALGIDADPGRAYATVDAWRGPWEALPRGYALVSPDDYESLSKEGVPMRLLARDTRRAIVSRR